MFVSKKKSAVTLPFASSVTRTADHWKKPVSESTCTLIIMAKRSMSVPASIIAMICGSSGISCVSETRPSAKKEPMKVA